VTTHAQEANIIEEDDASRVLRVAWFAEQGTHQHIGATRFLHHGGSEGIMARSE
jgi:hypothetical protein